MSNETSMILEMLSSGKITTEQALQLLKSLGPEQHPGEAAPRPAPVETPVEAEEAVRSGEEHPAPDGHVRFSGRRGWRQRPRFPDPSYAAAVSRLGVDFTPDQLIDLEMAEVTIEEIEDLLNARRQEWSTGDLARMLVHGVTRQMILQFHELGMGTLSPHHLVKFAIHGVDADLVRAARDAGFSSPEPEVLVNFAIHQVDFEAVKAAQALGPVSETDAVNMAIHSVTPAFIHAARDVFPRIRLHQVIAMRVHNVIPRYIADLHALDLKDLDADQVIKMKIHAVDADEARRFKEALGESLTARHLVKFSIHGVTPDYLLELAALGLKNLTPAQLVDMRIHGVEVESARRAVARFGENLSAQDLMEMAISGRLD